jgi:hypothetical protein
VRRTLYMAALSATSWNPAIRCVSAAAFAQDDASAAKAQWRQVADQVRVKLPKLAALLDPP